MCSRDAVHPRIKSCVTNAANGILTLIKWQQELNDPSAVSGGAHGAHGQLRGLQWLRTGPGDHVLGVTLLVFFDTSKPKAQGDSHDHAHRKCFSCQPKDGSCRHSQLEGPQGTEQPWAPLPRTQPRTCTQTLRPLRRKVHQEAPRRPASVGSAECRPFPLRQGVEFRQVSKNRASTPVMFYGSASGVRAKGELIRHLGDPTGNSSSCKCCLACASPPDTHTTHTLAFWKARMERKRGIEKK